MGRLNGCGDGNRPPLEGPDSRRLSRGRRRLVPLLQRTIVPASCLAAAAPLAGIHAPPGGGRTLAYPRHTAKPALHRFHDEERTGRLPRVLLVLFHERT